MTDTYTLYSEKNLLQIFQFLFGPKANYPNLFASNTPLFLSISKQDGDGFLVTTQHPYRKLLVNKA